MIHLPSNIYVLYGQCLLNICKKLSFCFNKTPVWYMLSGSVGEGVCLCMANPCGLNSDDVG